MNSQTFNFTVIPSIVKADTVSVIKIHPLGDNVKFKAGETYTVTIREVETACECFKEFPETNYKVCPNAEGDLEITHLFRGEQKHIIKLTRPESDLSSPYRNLTFRPKYGENVGATLAVYSLFDDLYGMKCYKGEVHCHTYASDGIQDVKHTVGNYRAAGYDFLAITDHYISFASEQAKEIFDSSSLDMTLIFGEEVHVPQERIHAVHLGGVESVNAYFREHRDDVIREVDQLIETLNIPDNVNKINYAWQLWIANKSREFGGLSILAHPHWIWNDVYFMASNVTKQLLKDGVYDALDLRDSDVDTSVALWNDLRAQGVNIPIVGSTDSHYTSAYNCNTPAKGGYTLVFSPDKSCKNILCSIRDGRSLCVNTSCEPEFVYGSYRHVKIAKFMLEHFFPYYMWLCRGQAALLCEYSEQNNDILAHLNHISQKYSNDFFGY